MANSGRFGDIFSTVKDAKNPDSDRDNKDNGSTPETKVRSGAKSKALSPQKKEKSKKVANPVSQEGRKMGKSKDPNYKMSMFYLTHELSDQLDTIVREQNKESRILPDLEKMDRSDIAALAIEAFVRKAQGTSVTTAIEVFESL